MSEPALRIESLGLAGVHLLHGVRHSDDRGHLRKVVVVAAASEEGVDIVVDEVITTTNAVAGTVRGLHHQSAPYEQTKTLWVTHGALYDVMVDLRPHERTYGAWIAVNLAAADDLALHIPAGVAHGYQTLEDDTTITYLIGGAFSPDHAQTLRWDDPTVGVGWPRPVSRISENDLRGIAWPPT